MGSISSLGPPQVCILLKVSLLLFLVLAHEVAYPKMGLSMVSWTQTAKLIYWTSTSSTSMESPRFSTEMNSLKACERDGRSTSVKLYSVLSTLVRHEFLIDLA